MPRKPSTTNAKAIQTVDKERLVVEMRLQGYTLEEAAKRAGYTNRSAAKKAVDRALQRTLQQPTEEYRALVIGRLEMVIRSNWTKMRAGDYQASRVVLRALQQEAQIMGINAPVKVNVAVLIKQMADRYGLSEDERRELKEIVTPLLTEEGMFYALESGED